MPRSQEREEYPVEVGAPKPAHGNTRRALPFHKMEVAESFVVPPSDYGRTNSARAHFKKKQFQKHGLLVEISSGRERDPRTGALVGYRFTMEKKEPHPERVRTIDHSGKVTYKLKATKREERRNGSE
jgi:hypothetical protein